jgi:hypothetical protein
MNVRADCPAVFHTGRNLILLLNFDMVNKRMGEEGRNSEKIF